MIDEKDITKYLSAIEKSKSGNDNLSGQPIQTIPKLERDFFIDPSCDIRGIEKMLFGKGVVIQKDCWLNIAFNNPKSRHLIEIGEGTNIGRRCTISAAKKISLGKNVLLGPNVFIADTSHEYKHAAVPIIHQPITTYEDEISIGDETWIGTNSVIVGNVRIGKHCTIGANTVVNKDIPDYCVAAGNPLRIVKMFDPESGRWVKIAEEDEVEKQVRKRGGDLLDFLVPITALKSIQVEVASYCNLRCPQCFQHIEGHTRGFFSREQWDKRIKPLLGQLNSIHLVGIGEPLLAKDFFYFVKDSTEHNVKVHTTSNLQLVNEEVAEEIVQCGVQELSFSCDGISKETYEKIRVNGKLEKLENSLELINKYKTKYKSLFPKLILNFGGMKSNIHELPRVVEFAKKYKIELIIAYHNVMYVRELSEESLYHYQEHSDRNFIEAKQLANKLGIAMFLPGLFSHPLKCTNDGLYCSYPFSHLYIYSDGRVGPCCMDFPDRYRLGDIHKSSVEEVWNSLPILKLRKELATGPSETCRYCVSHGKMDISDPKYFFRFKDRDEYLKGLNKTV